MRNIFLLFATALALASCTGREYLNWNVPVSGEEGFSHDEIILGEQLPDPYSVDNMSKALASVYPAGAGRAGVEPTDYYVRFLPKDEAQMRELADLGVELIDHPLDYRIVREGDWYHDPSVPEGEITWQYAVVPVGFDFPKSIRYERLDDCYLPEHAPATKADGIDWDAVEREAFRLTGNAGMLLPATREGSSAVMPRGRIGVIDPDYDSEPIGVKGVKVCCNAFVKIAVCYTDDEGYYRMSKSFSSDVRYRIVFQNIKGFSQGINYILIPLSVSTMGEGPASGLDLTVDCYSERKLFLRCVVNNAGYDYIAASRASSGALPAPPRDLRVWNFELLDCELVTMMHHGVLIETMASLADVPKEYQALMKLCQGDVLLGHSREETYADVYARATHVFAHAGHFTRTDKDWWWNYLEYCLRSYVSSGFENSYGVQGDAGCEYAEIAEMYAYYCQNVLMQRRYSGSYEIAGTDGWFCPQLLMYLDDRGLGLEQLAPLFTADVESIEVLHAKLLSYYPQFKTVINEAFARYDK